MNEPIANAPSTYGFSIHPLAEKFPAMPQKDFDELKESIRKYGLFEPIIVNAKSQVLDGRHRYRAITELGIYHPSSDTLGFDDVKGSNKDITEEQFIYDSNIHRRHLTDDQRVMLAAEFLPYLKAEAEVRKVEHLQKAGTTSNNKSVSQDSDSLTKRDTNAGKASTKLAEKAEVSRHKAEQAIAVKANAPELVSAVASGEITLKDAAKKAVPARPKQKSAPINLSNIPPASLELRCDRLWHQICSGSLDAFSTQAEKKTAMNHLMIAMLVAFHVMDDVNDMEDLYIRTSSVIKQAKPTPEEFSGLWLKVIEQALRAVTENKTSTPGTAAVPADLTRL